MDTAKPAAAPALTRARLQSIDILRGAVMIVMALDHVRDFFHDGAQHFSPNDLTQTTPILFFTRWITHFCAPTFMFLAGTSAYLQSRRGRSRLEIARFLWTRGLWLVVLEVTWVRWVGWRMNFDNAQIYLWVIWALGMSMIALGGLIFIPRKILLGLSLAVIVLHNSLDAVAPAQFGPLGWLWKILHVPDVILIAPATAIRTNYTLIPWIFVMAAGYCFGPVLDLDSERRRQLLLRLGGALIAAFIVLRWTNLYGDSSHWSTQASGPMTIASFLNCSKYPPSLLYLLMTLGSGILILGLLERVTLGDQHPLLAFGRVPLFYYLLHLPLIHGLALLLAWFRYGQAGFLLNAPPSLFGPAEGFPSNYGYSLGVVYLIWLGVVVTLYPACNWFAGLKRRSRSPVLSYL